MSKLIMPIVKSLMAGGDVKEMKLDLSDHDIKFNAGGAVITIAGIDVEGLDSVTEVSLFKPSDVSNQALDSKIALDHLKVVVSVSAQYTEDYQELLEITLGLKDLSFQSSLIAAVNKSRWMKKCIIMHCVLRTIDYLQFSSFAGNLVVDTLNVKQVSGYVVNPSLEADIANAINNVLSLGTQGFGPLISRVVYSVFQGPVKGELNVLLNKLLSYGTKSELPPVVPPVHQVPAPIVKTCVDPLECLINSIVIPIPDVCLPGTNICISSTTCKQFAVGSITTSYVAPTQYDGSFTGLGFFCQGNYKYLLTKGVVTMKLHDTNVNMDAVVGQNDVGYPVDLKFVDCSLNPFHLDVDFSKNPVLSPALEAAVETALKKLFCTKIVDKLSTNATYILQHYVDPVLDQLITNAVVDPIPEIVVNHPNLYLDWSALYRKVSKIVDKLLGMLDQDTGLFRVIYDEKFHMQALTNAIVAPLIDKLIDKLTDDTGAIFVDLSPFNIHTNLKNITLSLTSLAIRGLDTFTDFVLIEPSPVSNQTLHTTIAMDKLDATLGIKVFISEEYQEVLHFDVDLSKIDIQADLVAALSKTKFNGLYMDQLFNINCLLDITKYLEFTNIAVNVNVENLNVTQISGYVVPGTLEYDLIQAIDNLLLLINEGFKPLVTKTVYSIFQGPLRKLINRLLKKELMTSSSKCLDHVPSPYPVYVDWSMNGAMKTINNVVNNYFGPAGLNHAISKLTNGTGVIEVKLHNDTVVFDVSGLDSFYQLSLFNSRPEESPYALVSAIGLSSANSPQDTFALTVKRASNYQPGVKIAFSHVHLFLDMLLQLNTAAFANLHPNQIGVRGCLESTIADMNFQNVSLTVASASMSHGEKAKDITATIDKVLGALVRPDKIAGINAKIHANLTQAATVCHNGGIYPDSEDDVSPSTPHSSMWKSIPNYVYITVPIVLFLCAAYALSVYYEDHDPEKNNIASAMSATHAFLQDYFGDSLMCSGDLSLFIRLFLPVFTIGVIALFINSNMQNDAAIVKLKITVGQKSTDPIQLFAFGLADSIKDMWLAEVYVLSIAIAFFSASWPYIKLALMLVAWVLPTTKLSLRRRDQLLRFLDMFGKWSVMDIYVMLMLMCAFNFHIHLSTQLTVTSLVVPGWGFYSFLLATCFSLILGHTMLACHRHVVEKELPKELPEDSSTANGVVLLEKEYKKTEFLLNHEFTVEVKKGEVKQVKFTLLMKVIIVTTIIESMLLVFAGCFLETFEFDFLGLTGLLLKDANVVNYSLIDVGIKFPEASDGLASPAGILYMQVSYFILAMAMPLATLAICLFCFIVPWSMTALERIMIALEVVNSWSALDVFCVAVIATMLEIGTFVDFVIGNKCDQINVILSQYLDKVLSGDDKCLDIRTVMQTNSCVLFFGAFILFLVSRYTLDVVRSSIHERQRHYRCIYDELVKQNSLDHAERKMIPGLETIESIADNISVEEEERAENELAQIHQTKIMERYWEYLYRFLFKFRLIEEVEHAHHRERKNMGIQVSVDRLADITVH